MQSYAHRWQRRYAEARLLDLGMRPYREVWELQHRLHEAVREGREPDTWIVVEHPPVITLGRQAKRENVLLSDDALAARGHRRRRDRARRRRHVSRSRATRRLSDSPARTFSRNRAAGARARRRGHRHLRALRRRRRALERACRRLGRAQPNLRDRPGRPADGLAARHRAQRLDRARLRSSDQSVRSDRSRHHVAFEGKRAGTIGMERQRRAAEEAGADVRSHMAIERRSDARCGRAPLHVRKPPMAARFAAVGRRLRTRQGQGQCAGPQHRVQGSRLPESGRMLGRRNRNDHDSRRHLHARLPLLQREDRQPARRGRLARAGARRRSGARSGLEVSWCSPPSTATIFPTAAR